MAIREVYIGSLGPFLYDDTEPLPGQENEANPTLQKAINAEDQAGEYGSLILDPQLRTAIDAPGSDKQVIFLDSDNGDLLTIYDGTNYYRLAYAERSSVITNVDSPFTPTDVNDIILVDASSGSITINLPTAVGNTNLVFTIKRTDNSSNTVTVDANSTEIIEDEETKTLLFGDSMVIVSDGTQWWIL